MQSKERKPAAGIIALSSSGRASLKEKAGRLLKSRPPYSESALQAADAEGTSFSPDDECRLLIAAGPDDELRQELEKALYELENNPSPSFRTGAVFYGEGRGIKKLAFVFPGQGSQYVNMGADLVSLVPGSPELLKKAESSAETSSPLLSCIFPGPASGKREKNEQEDRLRQTDTAQPAIGAVSMVMLNAMKSLSVFPDAVCGHSYGELTALCAAGRIGLDDFFRLSAARGRYMAEAGKKGDAGSMLAVKADEEIITEMVGKNSLDLVLANRNSPEQQVLSGPTEHIRKMLEICRKNHVRAVVLPVSAAFHSRLVESASEPFSRIIEETEFRSTGIPVYSNTTGKPYPADSRAAKKLLQEHLMNPVNFVDEIEAMYRDGVDAFVEAGPRAVLSGLIRAILGKRPHAAVAVNASGGKKPAALDLAQAVCSLASMGLAADIEKLKALLCCTLEGPAQFL